MNDTSQNKLIVLVGPKGAGKSHIGRMIDDELGIHYLRIEAVWQELKNRRQDFLSQDYIREGRVLTLQAILAALRDGHVCIEASGVASDWDEYVNALRNLAPVIFVQVKASLEACRVRAQHRDQSQQVPIDQELFDTINQQAVGVELDWAASLVNEPFMSREALIAQLLPVLQGHGFSPQGPPLKV